MGTLYYSLTTPFFERYENEIKIQVYIVEIVVCYIKIIIKIHNNNIIILLLPSSSLWTVMGLDRVCDTFKSKAHQEVACVASRAGLVKLTHYGFVLQ